MVMEVGYVFEFLWYGLVLGVLGQLPYADCFKWYRSQGGRCRAVEAAMFEVFVLVPVVVYACRFRLSLLFLFIDLFF